MNTPSNPRASVPTQGGVNRSLGTKERPNSTSQTTVVTSTNAVHRPVAGPGEGSGTGLGSPTGDSRQRVENRR